MANEVATYKGAAIKEALEKLRFHLASVNSVCVALQQLGCTVKLTTYTPKGNPLVLIDGKAEEKLVVKLRGKSIL